MAGIKGLIFDLDGTIIDKRDGYTERLMGRVGRAVGREFSADDGHRLLYCIGAESRTEIVQQWGFEPRAFWPVFESCEFLDDKIDSTYLYDDAAFLKDLALPRGIVTHSSPVHADLLLKKVGMRGHFDPVVACTPATGFKPSGQPILLCAARMRLQPGEVAYVGDTLQDMLAARDAGVTGVYINRSRRPLRIAPDYEISSLEHLLEILKN